MSRLHAGRVQLFGVYLLLIISILLFPALGEEYADDARQAETETGSRPLTEEEQQAGILYADQDLSIRLVRFITDEAQIKVSFEISSLRDKTCTVFTNIPQSWYNGDDGMDGFTALKKMKEISGELITICGAGETIQYQCTWERGLCYDLPFFKMTSAQELGLEIRQISCPAAELNGNEQVGFSCIVSEASGSSDITGILSALADDESAELVIIRMENDEPLCIT